jgi:hypothetical protein
MTYNFQKTSALVHPQGTMATCFHRTNTGTIGGIFTEGFHAGSGQTYGEGLYTCFDLQSQLNPQMYHYGDIILEFKINVSNFLNLQDDYEKIINKLNEKIKHIEKVIYNKDLAEEENKLDTNVEKYEIKELNKLIKALPKDKIEYTSDIAQNFYSIVMAKFDGMIFNGRHDGLVCVIYNYAGNATPFRVRNGQTGEVIGKTITQEQKQTMIIMSIKEKLKTHPESYNHFKEMYPELFEKHSDIIEEAQVVGFEEKIKNNPEYYMEFPKEYPELFYKHKERFKALENEQWLFTFEKQIDHAPNHFKNAIEDLQQDYPELYEKYKDRLNQKLVDT